MERLTLCLSGLVVALVLGHFAVAGFLFIVRGVSGEQEEADSDTNITPPPAWVVGIFERFFFWLIVSFDVSGAAVAMMAWITVKSAATWNRPSATSPDRTGGQSSHFRLNLSIVLAGLLSMTFALIGGLICRVGLPT